MSVLFSIVIPVFNAQDFLPKCINSIIRQKRNNIEIIIIDDGSTDETPAICRRLLKTFPFVKLLTHSDNQGVGISRNRGNQMATGDYIIFVDSDDELFPRALLNLEKHIDLNDNPDVVVLHYKKETFPKSSYQLIRGMRDLNHDVGKFIEFISQKRFPLSDQWAFAVRRKFIESNAIAFSNVRIGEAELFMSSVICLMETFSGMPEQFYNKNDRDGSLNHTKGIVAAEACLQVLIDLFTNQNKIGISEIKLRFYEEYIQAAFGIFSGLLLLLEDKEIERLASTLGNYSTLNSQFKKQPENINLIMKEDSKDSYGALINFKSKLLEVKINAIKDYCETFDSVYLYCRSKYTEATILCLDGLGKKIVAIVDDSAEYSGTSLCGYETITAKNFFEIRAKDDANSLIIITHQKPKVIKKIESSLIRRGINKRQIKSIRY